MLDHEKLDVYRCAIQLFALCSRLVGALPRGHGNIADQMRRAALSVPLNIAEGAGKVTAADRRRFYSIARGSAMECGAVLDAMRVLELGNGDELDEAKALLVRVVAMLSKLCRSPPPS